MPGASTLIRMGEFNKIQSDYLQEVEGLPLLTLATCQSDKSLMIWAVIADGDEATERALILAEAQVNAKHIGTGLTISTMLIERSDRLDVPPQYTIHLG
jgi:hypothetical protein